MGSESTQKKKGRVRPPRVHIEYEVEKNGAIVMKELPFVVGVLSDLAGHNRELPKLKDREFEPIDRDDFDKVMKKLAPRLALRVDDKLTDGGGELSVELNFERMSDFSPEAIAKQVEPLSKLLDARTKLRDLLNRTEGNDRLEEMLEGIVSSDDVRKKLSDALGGGDAPAADGGDQPAGDS